MPAARCRRVQTGTRARQLRAADNVSEPALATLPALGSGGAGDVVRAADQVYDNWLALPIQPGRVRRTVSRVVGPGVWVFEQSQGVLDVLVNVRMTVVKMRDGGLFVHAPVAPTRECLSLLRELGAPVRYIVLPTSAVEHKASPPFAQRPNLSSS